MIEYSCIYGRNADLIESIVKVYPIEGKKVADVTYGKGNFWKKVDTTSFEFYPTDLMDGIDFRSLPYENDTIDVLVLDPPYTHTPAATFKANSTYNNVICDYKGHNGCMELYKGGMHEAYRVLKGGGMLWVKCQDELESGKQKWSHIELYNTAIELGYKSKDLFVLHQSAIPVRRYNYQYHARKNHSYMWIFIK